MRKLPQASRLADYLHKGIVLTCVGITLFGTMNLGMRVYNYYSVIKPQRDREEERLSLAEREASAVEVEMTDTALPLKA